MAGARGAIRFSSRCRAGTCTRREFILTAQSFDRAVTITPTDEPPAILAAEAAELAGAVAVADGDEIDLTPKPGAEEPIAPEE